MSTLKSYRWEILLGLISMIGVLLYILVIRNWIPNLYLHTAPTWFEKLITNLYPRFLIEKSRFDITFFLQKADQVIIRGELVLLLGLFVSITYKHSTTFKNRLTTFWNRTTPIQSISTLRKVYSVVMLIYISDWYFSLIDLSRLAVFYEPILFFKLLHIPLANEAIMTGLVLLFATGLILAFIGKWAWQASIISGCCFLLFQGYFQCFGKIAHTFTPFVYAAILIPFLFFEERKAIKAKQSTVPNWALVLIQMAIASCYLFGGLEKILISQLDWFKPDTLIAYIQLHQAPIGLYLLQFDWIMYVLPIGALIFQLGFISVLFYPKLKWFFLPMGLFFHWGTFALLGVGWWIHPWQVAYLFFVDWGKLQPFLGMENK